MSILVSAKDIRKTFGVRSLFEDVTFVVESGERIGLIGPNGAGKSTLLTILAGLTQPDEGDVSFQRGLRVGFLQQTPVLPDLTVEEALYDALADAHDGSGAARAHELLSKLDLEQHAHSPVNELSGGWQKRVALARELVREPDLLLLDEPTNHLDVESILWLEGFLMKSPFAVVTVTHDRLFLQRVANRIAELDKRNPQGLLSVNGDYSTYLQRKQELLAIQERQESTLRNRLRRETEWLLRGAKARTTKQQARIQATERLQDTVDELTARNQKRTTQIEFQSFEKKPKRLIEAKAISKKIEARTLYHNFDLFIGPGDRIGLLGVNGCGKSTLLRTLLGVEAPDAGIVLRSEHLKIAYFEQNRESLNPQLTLRKALCPYGDQVNYRGRLEHIQGYLARFLFKKEQADLAVGRLSGGEQSRVLLAQLMLKEANVLVLDEPTNDLDIETLDILEECLTDFDGAVLLVSHDRFFLDQVATQICAFNSDPDDPARIVSFSGLQQWEEWRKQKGRRKEAPKLQSGVAAPIAPHAPAAIDAKKRKLSFNESRELGQMEATIHKTEAELQRLEEEMKLPENQARSSKLAELCQAAANKQTEIDRLYQRWSELEALQSK